MKPTREILIAAAAALVSGGALVASLAAAATGWDLDRTVHRVRLDADQLAVLPAAAATAPLVEGLAAGAEGNPWNPATGVRIGPKVDLPPPPPVPLPPPPFLPVPAP